MDWNPHASYASRHWNMGAGRNRIKEPIDFQAGLIIQGLGEGAESPDLDLKNGEVPENK